VGLGFGAEFIPIYLHHPDVASLTICDTSQARLAEHGDRCGVESRRRSLGAMLALDAVDDITATKRAAAWMCIHQSALRGGEGVMVTAFD